MIGYRNCKTKIEIEGIFNSTIHGYAKKRISYLLNGRIKGNSARH